MKRTVTMMILVIVALAFERMAHYGVRSAFFSLLSDLGGAGLDSAATGRLLSASAGLEIVCLFGGGLACVVLRPAMVMAAGAGLFIVVALILGEARNEGMVWTAIVLQAIAQGLFKPAAFAAALIELPWPREHLRGALLVGMYAASNGAALVATTMAGGVHGQLGAAAVMRMGAALAAVAALVSGIAVAVDLLMKQTRRADGELHATTPNTAVSAPTMGPVAAGGALLLVVTIPYFAALSLAGDIQLDIVMRGDLGTKAFAVIQALNPLTVILTLAVVFTTLLVLHLRRVHITTLLGIGIGLLLVSQAALPLLFNIGDDGVDYRGAAAAPIAMVVVSVIMMAAGEALVGPLAMARGLGDLGRRWTGVAVALWMVATTTAAYGTSTLMASHPELRVWALGFFALLCLMGGILLLTFGRRLSIRCFGNDAVGAAATADNPAVTRLP